MNTTVSLDFSEKKKSKTKFPEITKGIYIPDELKEYTKFYLTDRNGMFNTFRYYNKSGGSYTTYLYPIFYNHSGFCCGIKVMGRFYSNDDLTNPVIKKRTEQQILHLLSSMYAGRKAYFKSGRTLLIEAAIASYQDKNLPILEKYGFKLRNKFVNANSGNTVYVMIKEMGIDG